MAGRTRAEDLPIYTADLETDPFKVGRLPVAFVIGFYDGKKFVYFWGNDWLDKFIEHIKTVPPGIIYVHNGGKFDFFHFMKLLAGKMMIINSRIVTAQTNYGHQFRDSYTILPFALKKYKKDDIDYRKLERRVREKHKEEIVSYLKGDCVYLYELCFAFRNEFGNQITIGSTAIKELLKIQKVDSLSEELDEEIRSRYYYGGRVQCFEKGIINTELKIYDVNSMYPSVMRDAMHPIGRPSSETKKITKDTCFVTVEGENHGALPIREKTGGLSFRQKYGVFHTTIHEYRIAVATGLFIPRRIIRCVNFDHRVTFAEFVNKFYNLRIESKKNANSILELFYKFVLNSAYGKFAQNPENFFDYRITDAYQTLTESGWEADTIHGEYIIWRKPSRIKRRFNVATAASITGAARSILLAAIANAKRPLYCDTDSLICEDLRGVKIDASILGAWKLEEQGTRAAICEKKLYAVFDNNKERNKARLESDKAKGADKRYRSRDGYVIVKQANKGARISPRDILEVAQGKTVTWRRESPSYKLHGQHIFIERRVKMNI